MKISETKDYFLKDGKYFFYLADTAWSAFTNPDLEEWDHYLNYRRNQGFNVLQINILPQGDRSENTWDNPKPFELDNQGKDDYSKPNLEYFKRASKMVAMAVERGFTPALVLLWGDRVFGTWNNKMFNSHFMPLECVEKYVHLVVEMFSDYKPIWLVSGDSDFPDEAKPWYLLSLNLLKKLTPNLLCTFHMGGELLVGDMAQDPGPDFYTYQSGHNRFKQNVTYKVATDYRSVQCKRPVINAEPCYEMIASEGIRFSAAEVRRATWWRLLSGAKAGVSYGAHGVWNWHREGVFYCSEDFFGLPLDWRNALQLPGAWDVAYAKKIYEMYHLYELDPCDDLLEEAQEVVRVSSNEERTKFAIYVPSACSIKIKLDLTRYNLIAINLMERRYEYPYIHYSSISMIQMLQNNSDVLLIGSVE